MAHADLSPEQDEGLRNAARAFQDGEEHRALVLLGRLAGSAAPGSAGWAVLERLRGLVLIHVLREVEGTFALERADAVLDQVAGERPTLTWLAGTPVEGTALEGTANRADEDAAPLPLPPSLESP